MKLKLPAGAFRAYLFDCDGTVADSMPLHCQAWGATLGECGCPFDENLFYAWGGKPSARIVAELNERHGLKMCVEEVERRKEDAYYELLPQLKPVPEVLEHIDAQYGKIPLAIVSGGRRDSVMRSLGTLQLFDRFETLVCADDYTHGKPHPEPYLLAAERLGIPPTDCLVFEDTDVGIESATAAGMASVKVPAPWERR